MKIPNSRLLGPAVCVLAALSLGLPTSGAFAEEKATVEDEKPVTVNAPTDRSEDYPANAEEARGRARWLHETIHGSLQVMHRDFFGTGEEDLSLPSQSLEDVFRQLAESWGVEIRWLGVNATRDDDHLPQDKFEENAAAALAAGKTEYASIVHGKYRFAGAIRMQNECLKCHVPNRTSLEDRIAGLAITIPLKSPPVEKTESPAR